MAKQIIAEKVFKDLIAKRAQTMLGLAGHLSHIKKTEKILVRPLLGQLLSQSIQLEELLDAYNARNNCQWCIFRSMTAAIKNFSDVSYELLHIKHSLPAYRLLPIEQDFVKATKQALNFTGDVILRSANRMLDEAKKLSLPIPENTGREKAYIEELPAGRLPHDCQTHVTETVSETVTLLSTAFLNLAAESDHVHAASRAKPEEYASYAADSLSEKNLRSLELRFHNLQSMYDTYVSGTKVEDMDTDLPVLRGHISVVFHLLRTATSFAHYYERHVNKSLCESQTRQVPLVHAPALLAMLMNYSINFSSQYVSSAQRLCRKMLKRYAEIGQIQVHAPRYRGFHVRPSTLISKLVQHYGSEVKMELEDEQYDAGSALELFRANEKINAKKRRWLSEQIVSLKLVPEDLGDNQISNIIHNVVLKLAERSKLVIYEQPLQLPERITKKQETLLEQVIAEITQLLAIGKIDVDTELEVKFIGDKRVLADIELLAESGYGEDNFGNNIALPEKLIYLRG